MWRRRRQRACSRLRRSAASLSHNRGCASRDSTPSSIRAARRETALEHPTAAVGEMKDVVVCVENTPPSTRDASPTGRRASLTHQVTLSALGAVSSASLSTKELVVGLTGYMALMMGIAVICFVLSMPALLVPLADPQLGVVPKNLGYFLVYNSWVA
jgi:hypothetical protein